MNEFKKIRYSRLGPKVAEALNRRNFEAYYFNDREEARQQIFKMIGSESSVGFGGTITADALGLRDEFRLRGNRVYDWISAPTDEEKAAVGHACLNADWFVMSSNAISEDGHLVNIDGRGNRLAAFLYGPENVLVIAGMNKVVKTAEDAYRRARHTAAPENMARFPDRKAPCAVTGFCSDCLSPDCICSQIVCTRQCFPPKRIKVLLIGEDLGL